MIQLILHLIGDYLTQSDWMAQNKTKHSLPAMAHALVYSLPFLFLTAHAPSPALAGMVILVTHFLIDRYRLARYVVWAKNWLGPHRMETKPEALERAKQEGRVSSGGIFMPGELGAFLYDYDNNPRRVEPTPTWRECSATGYPPERPIWLAVWLLIVADNTLHLAINWAALKWL